MNLQRVWWALGVVLLAAAIWVCLMPVNRLISAFEWSDKASHLLGHGILALYFTGLMPRDVVANSAGALLGLIAGWLGLSRWPDLAAWLLGRRAVK